jgi:hypothetical protein
MQGKMMFRSPPGADRSFVLSGSGLTGAGPSSTICDMSHLRQLRLCVCTMCASSFYAIRSDALCCGPTCRKRRSRGLAPGPRPRRPRSPGRDKRS